MKKKFLALVMTLSMVLSLVPMTALAAEGGQVEKEATVAAGETTNAGTNEGSQDSGSPTGGDNAGSGDGTDTNKTPDTNTGNKDENGSGNTGGTEPDGPSTSDTGSGAEGGNTGTGGTTEGSGTGGGNVTEPEKPEVPANAAKIGKTEYATIAQAIEAEESSSNTITLLRDVKENITIDKSLTLDLAGFTLAGADEENAVVTITGAETTVTIMGKANAEEKTVNGTITGGKKGGIRITDADITLNEVAVTENTTDDNGGGIFIKNGTLNITGGAVTKNKAAGKLESYTTDNGGGTIKGMYGGGGIYARNSSVTLNNVSISGNEQTDKPYHAGGILVYHGSLTMDGCTIKNNHARAVDGCGGGAYILHADSTISNSYIENNTAFNGAGIYFYDAVDHAEENCTGEHTHLITGSTISGNTASQIGGGMYLATTSNLTLRNSKLLNNDGASQGGAIVAYSAGTIELDGVSISENKAENGAGIYTLGTAVCKTDIRLLNGTAIDTNTATGYGGAIYAYNAANINIAANSAVYNNTAKSAGDDLLLNSSTFTLPNAKDMSGDRILSSDKVEIIGWYHDGWYKWNAAANDGNGGFEQIGRWTAETADEYTPVEKDSHAISLKAAHPLMYTLTYDVTGDLPEGYTAPAKQTLVNGSSYTVADVPASVTGSKDGVNGTFSFNGWKKDDGTVLTGEQKLTADLTLHGVWTFTKKSSSGGHRPSNPPVTIPDDVPTGLNGKDHYAYVVGYPDGMVYPQKNITRAEVATIFFRLLEDETREANMTKSNSYNDMKDGAWYTCAVSTLSKMGIIKGYEDGSFKPDASISRAEFAAIAARFDPDGDKTPATFSDVSSHWAKDEISIAANHGWIKGYEDGSFKPDQKITRAETMTLVNRVLKRLPETKDDLHKDMKTWPDNQNESAWFYLAVQEATNSHYQNLKKDGTHEKWESMRETRDWAALEK